MPWRFSLLISITICHILQLLGTLCVQRGIIFSTRSNNLLLIVVRQIALFNHFLTPACRSLSIGLFLAFFLHTCPAQVLCHTKISLTIEFTFGIIVNCLLFIISTQSRKKAKVFCDICTTVWAEYLYTWLLFQLFLPFHSKTRLYCFFFKILYNVVLRFYCKFSIKQLNFSIL